MCPVGATCFVDKLAASAVTELNLSGNALGDQGCGDICEAVIPSETVSTLSMSNCNLGRLSGIFVAKLLLKNNQTLTTLDLSHNNICNQGMFYDGLTALCDAVLNLTSLRNLNLERNQLRNMGCWPIAKMLQDERCSLECLNLANNEIRSRGATAIFKALEGNKTLNSLSLRSNLVDSDATYALQAMLLSTKTLYKIDLENNDLCERGGKLIASALIGNTSISMISLIMNEFRIKVCFTAILITCHPLEQAVVRMPRNGSMLM